MTGLLFVDTSLLIYSLDPANPGKRAKAVELLQRGMRAGVLITSPQSLNECYQVLAMKKRLVPNDEARAFVSALFPTCRAPLDLDTVKLAWETETLTRYSWWDCLLLAAARQAGCSYFLTEYLKDEHMIESLQILNPFVHDITATIA